jgi:hypothetical protein
MDTTAVSSAWLGGKLWDLLKAMINVRLCLSGTNSKTANMGGLFRGVASSTLGIVDGSARAVNITKLPSFDVCCCSVQSKWATVK